MAPSSRSMVSTRRARKPGAARARQAWHGGALVDGKFWHDPEAFGTAVGSTAFQGYNRLRPEHRWPSGRDPGCV